MNNSKASFNTFELCDFDTILSVNLTNFLKVGCVSVCCFVRRHKELVERKEAVDYWWAGEQRVDQPAAARLGVSEPNHSMSVLQFFPSPSGRSCLQELIFQLKAKKKSMSIKEYKRILNEANIK